MTDDELRAVRERAELATPGPWAVWPGPEYVGGGEDLCIGAGDTWLANVENRHCRKTAHHMGCHEEGCRLEEDSDICTFSDNITAEQRATAAFIAHARQDIPKLLTEIDHLRGAIAAQDDRARQAGEACGVPYELHGCGWPDAVAEEVQVLRADIASLKRQLAALMPMAPEQP